MQTLGRVFHPVNLGDKHSVDEPRRAYENVAYLSNPDRFLTLTRGSIGVLEAFDATVPIGEAHYGTWDENRLAVWTLRIGAQPIEVRWVAADREFRPAQ
jgi:hypothetical protein